MAADPSPAELIDARIDSLDDWRGAMLAKARELIHRAVPEVRESVKWVKPTNPFGVPVWEYGGILCTGETYRDKVKLTFMKGAQVDDPTGIFNASLEGNARRAVDLFAGHEFDEDAFVALLRSAAALNAPKA